MKKVSKVVLSMEPGEHWLVGGSRHLLVNCTHIEGGGMELTFRTKRVVVAEDGSILSATCSFILPMHDSTNDFIDHLANTTEIY